VLRYFLGGVNLVEELITIGWLLAGSALLTAITVGSSPFPVRVVRPVLIVCLLIGFQAGAAIMISPFGRSLVMAGPGAALMHQAPIIGLGVVLLFLMFEIGAGKIAPAAENHAWRKRLLAFALLVGAAAVALFLPRTAAEVFIVAALVLVVGVCIGALCEPSRWIPSIFAPFARRGALGRAVGRFLYPGWSSGFAFTLLMLSGFAATFWISSSFRDEENTFQFIALCGALLFPVAITRAFVASEEKALTSYLALQLGFVAITVVAMILDESLKWDARLFVSVIPTCALVMSLVDNEPSAGVVDFWHLAAATTVLSLLYLLRALRVPRTQTRIAEEESLRIAPAHGPLA
jgi:hypothetical protein